MPTLFDAIQIGDIAAANRIAMAPLTRDRAGPGQVATDLVATYYGQRATAGLIVAEATQINPVGQGYLDTPGVYSDAQVEGWRKTTAAVHAKGGKIVLQLWHVGRISHVSMQPDGGQPVSSVARPADSKTFTANGMEQVSAPRALRTDEIPGLVADYRHAARCAVDAGFDGVEVHGANGYLIEQFLRDSLNDRTDEYGGSIDNRTRLAVEVMQAVADEIGAGRTGIRISPVSPVNDIGQDSAPQKLFNRLIERLAPLKLAFIHVVEGATGSDRDNAPFDYDALRDLYKADHAAGVWMVNNGYTRRMALEAISTGHADMIAFGRPFIANPDLVRRLAQDLPLAPIDPDTLYGGGATGYIDYPTYDEVKV